MNKTLAELLKLIQKLYGKSAITKTIGTRTNVIKLPNNETKQYIKQELNIEAASDKLAKKAYEDMRELIRDVPKMNDQEVLTLKGNLQRLDNKLNPPMAEVTELGTGQKVSPEGIKTLIQQKGQKSPPGTLMGNLESRIKQLEASGKELEDIAKEKGGVKFSIPEEGIFNQEMSADNLFDTIIKQQDSFRKLQNRGLVTSTTREILQRDIKAGKLKLPKEIEDRIMLVDGNPGTVDPVDIFRTNYGEDALEQVDSLVPELARAQSYSDLVNIVEKKYPMKPLAKPRKETMNLDEATKAEQENVLTPGKAIAADSEEGKKITEQLLGKPKSKAEVVSLPTAEKILSDMRNLGPIEAMKEANKVLKREGPYKNLSDDTIKKIMDDINDHIFGGDLPVDPEDFATGGRVGYSDGTKPSAAENTPSQEIINRMIAQIKQLSKRGVDIATIKEIVGASDQMIKDVLGQASGGRVGFQKGTPAIFDQLEMDVPYPYGHKVENSSQGLDYLTGIERRGYAEGSTYDRYMSYLAALENQPTPTMVNPMLSNLTVTPTQSNAEASQVSFSGVPSTFQPTTMDMVGLMYSPIMGSLNIASRMSTGLSLAERAMDAMGIGRGPGGRTQGFGVDAANAQSVADQGVAVGDMGGEGGAAAGGDAGAAAASAAGSNDGPGGGTFAQGGRVKYLKGGLSYLMGL